LTALELERLTSQDGLDISLDDLKVLEDGTLAYKDSRVLLYIRDVPIYGDRNRSLDTICQIVPRSRKCESENDSTADTWYQQEPMESLI
jgi:hypothetical protein